MKKLALLLVTIFAISCSSENEEINDVTTKSNFKIELTQKGDINYGEISFYLVSDVEISNIDKDKVLTKEYFSEAKTYTFETSVNAEQFIYSYTHAIAIVNGINDNSKIETNIKVYKDGKLIVNKDFILDKDNLGVTENSDDLNS